MSYITSIFIYLRDIVEQLSIKHLTILGFSLVSLPLVLGLILGALKIGQLSHQGSKAIYDAAELIRINRTLGEIIENMERNASQFAVLHDTSLKTQYFAQAEQLNSEILTKLLDHTDALLAEQGARLVQQSTEFSKLFNSDFLSVDDVHSSFVVLRHIHQQIRHRSDQLIAQHATQVKTDADQASAQLIYGLLLIPVTMAIAAVFIILITRPMRKIIRHIKRLERGNFKHQIRLKGSIELVEIAYALENMRNRLHALELQKSSFIRHMSHELKTPLAAIREGTALLDDHSAGALNADQQEICNIIKSSVYRLQQHIEDLLDFNIVLDSTSLQDNEKLLLNPLIENVLATRQLDIKRKDITIHKSVSAIECLTNGKQLQVVIDNLLSNAIKYSPPQGEIEIKAEVEEQTLLLRVCDQGPGIADGIREKVFDAFYQGPAPIDNQIKSSGLGLTIVKELLMRLNGQISIGSGTNNVGTCISIQLPRAHLLGKK